MDEGGGEVEAPLHSPRVGADTPIGRGGEVDPLEQVVGAAAALGGRDPLQRRLQADQLAAGHQRVQGSFLQGDPDRGADGPRLGDHVVAGDGGAAAGGEQQSGEHPHRGRLAGPVRAEEGEDLALAYLDVYSLHGEHIVEGTLESFYDDGWSVGRLHLGAGNPTEPGWPGSCKGFPAAAFGAVRRQNPGRNWCRSPVLPSSMPKTDDNRRPGRAWASLAAAGCLFATLVALLAPGAADSAPLRVLVLGQTVESPKASCPGKIVNNVEITPCRVEGHVSGFQAIAEGIQRPYEAPFEGKVVAWSITLAKPSKTKTSTTVDEISVFNELLGEPSQARIGILRPVDEETKPPRYKLVRQSPLEVLNPYFGSTPVFALEHPLTILKGQIVALTVPTWAPMFAFNVSGENTWRGSRLPEHCASKEDIQGGHPQQGVGKTKTYGCYYSNARLLYTATLVKKP